MTRPDNSVRVCVQCFCEDQNEERATERESSESVGARKTGITRRNIGNVQANQIWTRIALAFTLAIFARLAAAFLIAGCLRGCCYRF